MFFFFFFSYQQLTAILALELLYLALTGCKEYLETQCFHHRVANQAILNKLNIITSVSPNLWMMVTYRWVCIRKDNDKEIHTFPKHISMMLWPQKGSLKKTQTRILDNRLYYTRKIDYIEKVRSLVLFG